jgi:hypothetical protein
MNKKILRNYDPYNIWIFVSVENPRWLQPQDKHVTQYDPVGLSIL